eukprot:g32093.t1
MCAVPNLVHTTYGILFQRRFFDAGIFNFDAAAQAILRAYPSGGPSRDYVITSCMLEDNVAALSTLVASVGWWQADHVYAFVCSGRSLPQWRGAIRKHGGLDVQMHYLHILNMSSATPRPARLERSHGQGDKLLVVDYYAPWCKNCQKMLRYMQKISQEEMLGHHIQKRHTCMISIHRSRSEKFRHVEFVSVDFDASEELVKSRRVKLLPTMEIYRAAGSRRPLADLVELCPGAAVAPRPARGGARAPCSDFKAKILKHSCREGNPRERVEHIGAEGFAGVACWAPQQFCFSALLPRTVRNRTWQINQESIAQCLPSTATFYHARRICQALGASLATMEQVIELKCNGIVPSVSFEPIPAVPGRPKFVAEDVFSLLDIRQDMRQTPIILCNHVCYLDGMVLASVFHGPKIIAMKGTLRLGTEHAELVGRQPLLLFPEGTTSNGQGLLEFRKGAFVPGVPVRPAVLCYTGSWDPANTSYRETDGKIQAIGDTEWAEQFLGHIFHSLQIRVLPPYEPSEESEKDWNRIILRLRRGRWKLGNIFGKTWEEKADPQLYASNVRKVMSDAHAELRKEVELKAKQHSIQAFAQKGVDFVEALAVDGDDLGSPTTPVWEGAGTRRTRLHQRAASNRSRRHKPESGDAAGGPAMPDERNTRIPASLGYRLGATYLAEFSAAQDPSKTSESTSEEEGRPSFFVPSATFPKDKKDCLERGAVEMLLRAARFRGSALRRCPRYVDALTLSNQAVKDREDARPQVPTPPPVRVAYDVLCWFIDVVFEDRPIQRFWFLETVARMPYFAYSSVLHLYETFGWWRSPELRAVHAAEEDNELHHLLVMESLGGDQRWLDRFFAQHGAVAYYWLLVLFFFVDPKWSYNFSRLIEAHAVDTYGEFADANKERLRTGLPEHLATAFKPGCCTAVGPKIPPPPIAVEYYLNDEMYLFDKMHTSLPPNFKRRPPCATLHDVFCNIRDDEEQRVSRLAQAR